MEIEARQRGALKTIAIATAALWVASPAAAAGSLEIFPDSRFFWLIGLFVVLVYPVDKLLFSPLLKVLDDRRERIEGARNRAAQVAKEADSVLARYESAVRGAKDEAEGARRSQVDEARRAQSEKMVAARGEAEQRLVGARAEVGRMLDEARVELRGQAEALAREAASRVLGRPLS